MPSDLPDELPFRPVAPQGAMATLMRMISDSESELCRRLDDMELATMEVAHLLTSPSDDLSDDTHFPARVEKSLGRIDEGLGAACCSLTEIRASLRDSEAAIRLGFDGLAQQFGTLLIQQADAHQGSAAPVTRLAAAAEPQACPAALGQNQHLADMLTDIRGRLDTLLDASAPAGGSPPDLSSLQLELGRGLDRLAALLGRQDHRRDAERQGMLALQRALAATLKRLETAVTVQQEQGALSSEHMPGHLQDVVARLDRMQRQLDAFGSSASDLTPLRVEIARAVDRISAQIGGQSHRLEAERQALGRFLTGLGSLFNRLDSAALRLEAQEPPQRLEARLTQIEQDLAGLRKSVAQEVPEALRDMTMVLAEMMARQERQQAARLRDSA